MYECQPLKTLEDLEQWTAEEFPNKLKQSTISLRVKRHGDGTVPKTLVCHDMRGGYLEDRFVNLRLQTNGMQCC